MAIDMVLRTLVVAFLSVSLGIFIFRLSSDVKGRKKLGRDFGLAFSAFITAWIATELIAILAPEAWLDADDVLHVGILIGFAAWMNIRWRQSLRRAVEAP
ncbi:MAG: hypothetical protein LN412_08250 [Candidatus Thermoplasmatota archaeon]|nr:hypothetical protein [Candidatus Thermoplasmatota archaeon]